MADLLQSLNFLIWIKGPAAIQVMKNSLIGLIRSVWIHYLKTFTAEEKEHMEQFIEDMNTGFAVADFKRKEWIVKCGHRLCEILLKKLLEKRHNPKSLKIVWKTNCTTKQPTHNCLPGTFDHHRTLCKTYYWHIANMFMFYDGETNKVPSSCPGDADVALVLKMMKNCTLFEVDEIKIYDTVIDIRNCIFHTGEYNIEEQRMNSMIDDMIKLLQKVNGLSECKRKHKDQIKHGIEELQKIKNRKLVMISLERDRKSMAIRALQLQKEAIEFDINTGKYDTTALRRILEDINARIQEYTNSSERTKCLHDQRIDEERRRQKEEDKKMKEFEEKMRPFKARIQSLEEELRNKESECQKLRYDHDFHQRTCETCQQHQERMTRKCVIS